MNLSQTMAPDFYCIACRFFGTVPGVWDGSRKKNPALFLRPARPAIYFSQYQLNPKLMLKNFIARHPKSRSHLPNSVLYRHWSDSHDKPPLSCDIDNLNASLLKFDLQILKF
ncbi:MAG: hypothetical protein K0S09_372 [Sphingobacteriaceae bacterium]|jgi:hypothetical protein|nr:hypothetical protein [Sphingobacteriaceae bacterium]